MTATARKERLTIQALARISLAEAGGDRQAATDAMVRRVERDADLFRELMAPLVRNACYDALRHELRAERQAIYCAPNYTKGGNGARVIHLANGNTLLDFPLPTAGNIRLRQASRQDVEDAAALYERNGRDAFFKARWLRLIAARVGDNQTVGDVLTVDVLADLQQEAANA